MIRKFGSLFLFCDVNPPAHFLPMNKGIIYIIILFIDIFYKRGPCTNMLQWVKFVFQFIEYQNKGMYFFGIKQGFNFLKIATWAFWYIFTLSLITVKFLVTTSIYYMCKKMYNVLPCHCMIIPIQNYSILVYKYPYIRNAILPI